jgi:hypothetical protein
VSDGEPTQVTEGAPARVAPSGPGGSTTASTVRVTPSPVVSATWEKHAVLPEHDDQYPPPPGDSPPIPDKAKAKLQIETRGVADNTPVSISIRRCASGEVVAGMPLAGLRVKNDRVVDASGEAPSVSFRAEHDPWKDWKKPFFYFRVTISGHSTDSERDCDAHPEQCLRVKYWIPCVAEGSTLLFVGDECNSVKSIVQGVEGGDSKVQDVGTPLPIVATFNSLLRNTYAVHVASHGDCIHRQQLPVTSIADIGQPESVSDPDAWQGVISVSAPSFRDNDIGGAEPRFPKVLFYADCCLAGFEPSIANRMRLLGCRYLIMFRRIIPDHEAPMMARAFWNAWAEKKFEPATIPDCFMRVSGDHYATMRPVLYGDGGRQDPQDTGALGISYAGWTAIAIALGVGVTALTALGIWGIATELEK